MSLDGFIADARGGYDWIVTDPTVDFAAIYHEFDIALMGRRTFELAQSGPGAKIPGMQTVVCSRTLRAADFPEFTITADAARTVAEVRQKPGKDIWLFGGGALFRSLLDAGIVDMVEIAVMPILLSEGIPLLPAGNRSPRLQLKQSKTLRDGVLALTYAVSNQTFQ